MNGYKIVRNVVAEHLRHFIERSGVFQHEKLKISGLIETVECLFW